MTDLKAEQQKGMRNAIITQFFGVLGMQTFENGVLLLYFTVLGISPVIILVLLALPNGVSMLFRLPIGYAADQVGKKAFGTIGVWLTVLGYAMIPLAGFLQGMMQRGLIVFGILVLAVGKMLFAAGWHAMIGGLVPQNMRARFYGRMRISFMLGGILVTALVSWLLGEQSPVWKFQVILGALTCCFLLRVVFYVRVPEVEQTGQRAGGFINALWQVLSNAPYVSFCSYVFLIHLFTKGSVNLFALVEKEVLGLDDGMVVLLANVTLSGGVVGMLMAGRLIDRVGTRHVFMVCHLAFAISMYMFVVREGIPLPMNIVLASAHLLFGITAAASGLAIMSEMLSLIPPWNKALSTSLCVCLILGGASLSGLVSAGLLNLGLLKGRWTMFGLTLSDYDSILFAYASMVLLLLVTLTLVPSVISRPNWEPPTTQ